MTIKSGQYFISIFFCLSFFLVSRPIFLRQKEKLWIECLFVLFLFIYTNDKKHPSLFFQSRHLYCPFFFNVIIKNSQILKRVVSLIIFFVTMKKQKEEKRFREEKITSMWFFPMKKKKTILQTNYSWFFLNFEFFLFTQHKKVLNYLNFKVFGCLIYIRTGHCTKKKTEIQKSKIIISKNVTFFL